MVSLRCKILVKQELANMNLAHAVVELGFVDILEEITQKQRDQLKKNLLRSGLELMDDKKSIIIEQIKNIITEMIHYSDEIPDVNYSEFISTKLVCRQAKVH